MKKHKSTYGEYTIGEFIQALKKTAEETPYLNLNSPMLISDYNMTGFKYEFDILPTFSQKHHTAGLCLFHSLPSETEEEEIEANVKPTVEPIEEVEEESSFMKFVSWYKK